MKKFFLFSTLTVFFSGIVLGQGSDASGRRESTEVVRTAVPFLTIAPDSRSGAMGDAGVATSPDLSSQHWNASKYAFMDDRFGFAVAYTPWLQNLGVADLNLAYLSGFYKVDQRQSVSMGLKYFNLGSVTLTDESGNVHGSASPNEFAFDLGYSRLLGENFSMAFVFRFIHSDISGGTGAITGTQEYTPGNSYAADVSGYYQKEMSIANYDGEFAFGFNISNIGTKISYNEGSNREFIPTNLRLGARYGIDLDRYNKVCLTVDLNKLLVPTPSQTDTVNIGVFDGMIKSLYDESDPNDDESAFSENLSEIMWSIGAEYLYKETFAVRGGYFYENQFKGNRKYFTAGVGFTMNIFTLDFSYLVPTGVGPGSPLANTWRFTLGFKFE